MSMFGGRSMKGILGGQNDLSSAEYQNAVYNAAKDQLSFHNNSGRFVEAVTTGTYPVSSYQGQIHRDNNTGVMRVWDGSSWHSMSPGPHDYITPQAICFRLRMDYASLREKGVEILNVRQVIDEVHVVIGHKDQTLILKDEAGSFPSDEFVAKMRLLL